MNSKPNVIKWSAIATGTAVAALAAYVALNSVDCEAPDLSRFDNKQERPSDADNVFCGLMAATNVVSEVTGLPIMDSAFGLGGQASAGQVAEGGAEKASDAASLDAFRAERREFWNRYYNKRLDTTGEEKDAVLADAAKALALFHEAAQRKRWYAFDPSTGDRDVFPSLSEMLKLLALVGLDADRHVERGEIGSAIESVRDIVNLANKMEHGAETTVMWLISTAFHRRGVSRAVKIVESGKATDEELVRLQEVIRSADAKSRPERLRRMMNNEISLVFAYLTNADRIFEPEVLRCLGLSVGIHIVRNPLIRRYAFHRNRTWAKYAGLVDKVKDMYSRGYDKSAWDEFDDMFDNEMSDDGWRFGPNFVGRRGFAAVMPSWRRTAVSNAQVEFDISVAEAVVAAELFRRKTGAYPKSLTDLVPEYLPSVPEDPFRKGAALNYDAARGVIWTVGEHGKFDGDLDNRKTEIKPGRNRRYIANINGKQ